MGSFVITLREGFEATLMIGLILACLSKTGQKEEHSRSVWLGVMAGALASFLIGGVLFLSAGELHGDSESVYEGTTMIIAAGVVTWMAFWMRKQAATIGGHLRAQVSDSLRIGGGLALASVAFIGVGREGIETALFLFASTGQSGAGVTIGSAVAGLVTAVVLGVLFYRGALKMNVSRFFLVTSVLVIGFAAFLVYSGLHAFAEVAGSDALSVVAAALAVLYGAGLAVAYVRGAQRPRVEPATAEAA